MNKKIEGLRSLVANESLPLAERKDAAAYVIRLMVESIPVPSADDAEVVTLQKPWQDRWLAELGAAATSGRSLSGYSVKDALEEVHNRHQLRAVLAVVVDDNAPRLERLAACQLVLDDSHPEGHWRKNNFSAEKLLEHVKTPEGVDYWGRQWGPIARPPMELGDLWVL